MVKVKDKYPKTKKALEQAMKVVQRELPDGKLKVEMLSQLVDLDERIGSNGNKPKEER